MFVCVVCVVSMCLRDILFCVVFVGVVALCLCLLCFLYWLCLLLVVLLLRSVVS